MARYKIAIFTLIAVLVISLGFNVYQYGVNQTATQENQSASAKQEMVNQLMHTQNNVNTNSSNSKLP
jgi:preprotein translocase subunit SecY